MIDVGGEWLEGFHIETVRAVPVRETYSEDALGWRAGIRATWLLYRREKWELLEELGMDANALRTKLDSYPYDDDLTDGQVRWLREKVPELETASFRLRALYALKYRLQEMNVANTKQQQPVEEEKTYLAEVWNEKEPAKSDMQAYQLVEKYRDSIQAVDGAVDMAAARGSGPAIIRVITRGKCLAANPEDMFPGEGLKFTSVVGVRIPIPADAVEMPGEEAEAGSDA